MEELPCVKADREAAERLSEILERPMPEPGMVGVVGMFDPWDIFDSLYGSYDQEFDNCAIATLQDIVDGKRRRNDLASDMIREMLCAANLCDYGTSPRHPFPTTHSQPLLPVLLDRWREFSRIQWTLDPSP